MTMQRQSLTYANVVESDVIIDKNDHRWVVLNPRVYDELVDFGLADEKTPTVRLHNMLKLRTDPVTVLRPEPYSQEKRDADVKGREEAMDEALRKRAPATEPPPEDPSNTTFEKLVEDAEAARNVTDTLGGEVASFETARHEHARKVAEETGVPMELPLWKEMTEPERLTHLYLVHGVWGYDVTKLGELDELHENAHTADVTLAAHQHVAGLR